MHAPFWSTFTLIAELFVSGAIYYTLLTGYFWNSFPTLVAGIAVGYEILFNITYMVSRTIADTASPLESRTAELFAAAHGILSLLMFIGLLVFFFFAWRAYRHGSNFFKNRPALTVTFGFFWGLSILSGMVLYALLYLF
ncbi:MAG: hypothetical protein KGI60_02530 [Patescibacteria group bacterium]|nr:hypothetical protein [Patescibacteria group bacterium]